jgi:hypothetical protein
VSAPHDHTLSVREWELRRRRVVVGLALVAVGCFAGSYFCPWWNFDLWAPQYPSGLSLVISLSGVTGDTSEINIINHYIGMHPLEASAVLERASGGWLVGGLCTALAAATLLVGRKLNWALGAMAVAFPIGFIVDSQYWLYQAGHDLDTKAPVHIKPFWPALFGAGKVGQFRTEAYPALGFWLALLGVALVGVAVWQRRRVCKVCPHHDDCGLHCAPNLLGVKP